jgi:urea transport system permease protein
MKNFISAFCLLLLLALPARAQDAFLDALPGLAGGYGEQADTAARLGTLADPRALPILSAMSEGCCCPTAPTPPPASPSMRRLPSRCG